MHAGKRWTIAPPHPAAEGLAARLKVSPLIAQILATRGHIEPDVCRDFLHPSLKMLHDPAGIPNLSRAAERIAKAIADKQKIVVYGDYDVDGITATSILWHAIRRLGGTVDYYIPHRIDEGYGLNTQAIADICNGGAGLIISVDCGVTAIEPAQIAAERGVDLVITDHHEWKETADVPHLPQCCAIVHPRLPHDGATYANPHLCGAGVAFKLAWGIGQAVRGGNKVTDDFRNFLVDATALAALGTIADVVPLVGENRVLAAFGLGGLKASKLTGICALIESANLNGQKLDSFHVGFLLAPRLNASGRMGHARLAVEMLTEADHSRATEIAVYLEQQNRQRQTMEKQIVQSAIEQVVNLKQDGDDSSAIVVGAEGWHPGIIGIVASRLVDKFHRPAVMIALNNGHGQGSCRSIPGFHLAHALQACEQYLETFGGHEMAAGLKIQTDRLDEFRDAFRDYARQTIAPELLIPEIKLDGEARLNQITAALINDLARLGPFGHGNRKPLLACYGLELAAAPRRVGKTGDHLQLYVKKDGTSMKGIAFGLGKLSDTLKPGMQIDLAVEPTLNDFNGRVNVELTVKDLRVVGRE
jgi:single-stranded-DNA-specific exonuclease